MTTTSRPPGITSSLFRDLTILRDQKSRRVSSWDRSGRNQDWIDIAPGATATLADLRGAGCINHFYAAPLSFDRMYLRKVVIRMYWDGEDTPSVEVPFGDFFGVTNGKLRYFTSLLLAVNPGGFGASACDGFNSYFPMPFADGARIEISNDQADASLRLWYHVDFEQYEALGEDVSRFHAQWRRENPTSPEAQPAEFWGGANLSGDANYVILEAEGRGNYVGFILGVDNLVGSWWGEGDDMVFVDGETWPPSFHGTGTEEIFGGGACPNQEYAGPYTGFHLISDTGWAGKNGMYRLFVNDPIRFQRSIKVTLEHGHNNDLANDYSTVAFWYQNEPHRTFPTLPPVQERLPRSTPDMIELQSRDRVLRERIWQAAGKLPPELWLTLMVEVWRPLNQALNDEDHTLAKNIMDRLDTTLSEHLNDGS